MGHVADKAALRAVVAFAGPGVEELGVFRQVGGVAGEKGFDGSEGFGVHVGVHSVVILVGVEVDTGNGVGVGVGTYPPKRYMYRFRTTSAR